MAWLIHRDKKKTDEYLMHYGVKNQKWGERRYQDEDGNYTDEGIRHYRELRKKREEELREKHTQASKDLSAKRAVNNLADTKAKLQGEVAGAMYRSGLLDHFYKQPAGTAIIRVGNDFIFGHKDELEKQLQNLSDSGKSLKDIEILATNVYDTTVVDIDENGKVTGNRSYVDNYIEAWKQEHKSKSTTK